MRTDKPRKTIIYPSGLPALHRSTGTIQATPEKQAVSLRLQVELVVAPTARSVELRYLAPRLGQALSQANPI